MARFRILKVLMYVVDYKELGSSASRNSYAL